MLHKWKPKFEFFHVIFEFFKSFLKCMVLTPLGMHVEVYTCAKFGLIWAMLGEKIARYI